MGTTSPLDSLDPADALSLGDWEILHAVGEGLLRFEPGTGIPVPGIAADLPEVSEDGLRYTFEIREGVTFPDGSVLTAPDYVAGIQRVMRLGGRGSDLVNLYVARVEAPDDQTVVFELRDAYAFFPTLVAGTPYLAFHPDSFPEDQLAPNPESPIYGAGPWFIESLGPGEVVLAENTGYDDLDGAPRRVVITVYENSTELADALSGGAVDVVWRGLDPTALAELSSSEEITVEPVQGGTLHFLTVDHGDGPTANPQVRAALAELVDREALVEAALDQRFTPAFSPLPSGLTAAAEPFLDLYGEPDLPGAIELLTEAGFTEAAPAEIELAFPPERFGLNIAAAMEQLQLQIESTGLVSVTLTAEPWSTYVGSVVDRKYDLAFLGWLHDFPDPHNYLAPFVLEGGLGGSGVGLEDGELPGMVTAAAAELDQEARAQLYVDVQEQFASDVVTIPLWIEHPLIGYGKRVSGDDGLPNPETLNIGQNLMLDFRVIRLGEDGVG